MRKIFLLLAGAVVLGGCAKVSHLDQLLTLKGLADEQVEMSQYIEAQDQKFELMVEEKKAGTLGQHHNKSKIERTFGEPVYIKHVARDNLDLEVWLYRYATEFFGSDKIYLYFDSDGNLVDSEYIEVDNEQIGQKAAQEN